MRRLSSLSSTTRIFFSDIGFPFLPACRTRIAGLVCRAPDPAHDQYAAAPSVSQTRALRVDLFEAFRLAREDAGPHPLCAEPHGSAAPRKRPDRAVQLPVRAPPRGPLHPPHRG